MPHIQLLQLICHHSIIMMLVVKHVVQGEPFTLQLSQLTGQHLAIIQLISWSAMHLIQDPEEPFIVALSQFKGHSSIIIQPIVVEEQ